MRKVNWNRDHTPLISVVIPTYNRQNTITYCLKSVLAQTYKNFEILVVDDGSTDQTVPIVSEICDPRIRLIEAKKNGGAQAARNIGIKAAKGEWIAFWTQTIIGNLINSKSKCKFYSIITSIKIL